MIVLKHIPGYSKVDHLGPEIIARVRGIAGSNMFRTVREAAEAAHQAADELGDTLKGHGLPRIDAVHINGGYRSMRVI